jgi:hypothetical protein
MGAPASAWSTTAIGSKLSDDAMKPRCLFLASALVLSAAGCHKSSVTPAKTWYDAAPLLDSLRSEERAGAAQAAGVKGIEDLPLYDLDIDLDDALAKLDLDETVWFTNSYGTPLDEIVLRVYVNAVGGSPQVKLVSGSCADGPSCSVSAETPSAIVAKLATPLPVGGRVRVRLHLTAELREIEASRTTMLAQGFESLQRMQSGKSAGDYGLLARGEEIASLASFYALLGRYRDGKWERGESSTLGDLGADGISNVRAKLTVPADALVVSSGITSQETALRSNEAGARREVRVVAALVRDFSALVSRRFSSATRNVGGVEVRSHYLSRDEDAGKKVLDAAAESLAAYEKLYGPYPWVDLDVVEAPLVGGAGGVEFSGLVTVASMLYRPALSEGPLGMLTGLLGGPSGKQMGEMTDSMLEFVTAHEVAHQYFPGLVGSDSRGHPFMDESLAQWSAVRYFKARYGRERAQLEADRQVLANYHTMRLLDEADGAVDRPVDAFKTELGYAGLVYGKGPYFFHALDKEVGEDVYDRAMRTYVDRNRFRSAPPRAIVELLAQGDKAAAVRALATRWLDEAHGDEDLGKPDMRRLLAGWIGEDAAKNMGPELDTAMKLMLKLLGPGGGGDGDASDLLKGLLKGAP